MKVISKELIISLHKMLIEKTGGLHGIRDENLLESAILNAFQTFDGMDLYPGDLEKIANIGFSLIKNHAFIDGNKRIGVLVIVILLKENGYKVDWKNQELIDIGLNVASGKMKKSDLKKFIRNKIGA